MKLPIMPQSLSLRLMGYAWFRQASSRSPVVHGHPYWTLVAASGGRDASHTGAARLPVVSVVTAGHGHGPWKALLAPLVAAFDALLGTVNDSIE
jgi:hypothetical protein